MNGANYEVLRCEAIRRSHVFVPNYSPQDYVLKYSKPAFLPTMFLNVWKVIEKAQLLYIFLHLMKNDDDYRGFIMYSGASSEVNLICIILLEDSL